HPFGTRRKWKRIEVSYRLPPLITNTAVCDAQRKALYFHRTALRLQRLSKFGKDHFRLAQYDRIDGGARLQYLLMNYGGIKTIHSDVRIKLPLHEIEKGVEFQVRTPVIDHM